MLEQGSLMNLIAYGPQDVYLTGNPIITLKDMIREKQNRLRSMYKNSSAFKRQYNNFEVSLSRVEDEIVSNTQPMQKTSIQQDLINSIGIILYVGAAASVGAIRLLGFDV